MTATYINTCKPNRIKWRSANITTFKFDNIIRQVSRNFLPIHFINNHFLKQKHDILSTHIYYLSCHTVSRLRTFVYHLHIPLSFGLIVDNMVRTHATGDTNNLKFKQDGQQPCVKYMWGVCIYNNLVLLLTLTNNVVTKLQRWSSNSS